MSIRILVLHNRYRLTGGEERVVTNEVGMLRRAGHAVSLEVVPRPNPLSALEGARLLLKAPYDAARKVWMADLLERHSPDVVHVHNFFPQLTYAVHEAAFERGVAVVQTLHNYRLLCAAASFERNGNVCELCVSGSSMNAVRYACYRNSYLASAALVRMQKHNSRLIANVSKFIVLTEFMKRKFLEGGLPAEKIFTKPNFHPGSVVGNSDVVRSGALFVGRISREKGVEPLIQAWRSLPQVPLTVIGDGPLRAQLQKTAPRNVQFLGRLEWTEVEVAMRRASALVVPSIWHEPFGMAVVEGYANGLPALASHIGSLPEIVKEGTTGIHFEPNNPAALAEAVAALFANPSRLEAMGHAARAEYERLYTEEPNLRLLEDCYELAIQARRLVG